MKKFDYLLVGAGLFSAVFAYNATKNGKTCIVVEKRDHIGGNTFCETINGINVHKYGAHIFHTSSRRVWDFVNSVAEFNRYTNSPIANYKGEIYNLPFNMNTFNKMWGVVTPKEAQNIIESQQKVTEGTPKNLEEQAISLVGTDIFEKLIKGYTEKQWGRDCKDLPSFIIKRLPVRYTYDNNYFDDLYQGVAIGGYNSLTEKLFCGCEILLNTDYNLDRKKFNSLAQKVLYTGTLDSLFDYKYGCLEYRSLRFETETLDVENYQGNAVVNYTDKKVPYTRIIEHKHFENCDSLKTVITREYPLKWEKGLEPYYPICDHKNNEIFEKYKALAQKEKNMLFGGRLADYHYYDMDKTVGNALDLAQKEFNYEHL